MSLQAMVAAAASPKENIRKLFDTVQVLSASAYDTAWAAMVPCPASASAAAAPHLPGCLNWVLQNQHKDGSWGLHPTDPFLQKDALSSTLACALALKRWGIGDQHVHDGLGFIERNSGCLRDPIQQSPIGFHIIFPAMVETAAEDYNLNLPLQAANIDPMLRKRDDWLLMINTEASVRSTGHDAYLAYISEGMGNSRRHWETALRFQRKNGSLFNSPSATAAAVIHRHDANSLAYLRTLIHDLQYSTAGGNNVVAVPTIYPHGVQTRLSLIDAIESLGIDHHFRNEIKEALDEIYRCWQQGEEDIFLDSTTCAMAFRILRLNGYSVSPDVFNRFTEYRFWNDTMEGYLKHEKAVLELHKASNVILPDEPILERQQIWTRESLIQLLGDQESSHHHQHHRSYNNYHGVNHRPRPHKSVITEVQNVLTYPFRSDLEPLACKRTIEQYSTDTRKTLKTSFSSPNFGGQDFLTLAADDFNSLQLLHREELGNLMLWLKEKRLDELRSAKSMTSYCYFHALAIFSNPEQSDARSIFTKNASLLTFIDDLFDMFGTPEEHLNLVHLLERWDPIAPKVDFCSDRVETLYWAVHATICETAEIVLRVHGAQSAPKIMDHVVDLWVDVLKGMLQETEWSGSRKIPTLDQYMRNASTTLALGPMFLPCLYFSGDKDHKLSNEVVKSAQFQKLLNHTSTCGRLLNDSRGFQRELAQGKANAVSLRVMMRSRSTQGSGLSRSSGEENVGAITSSVEEEAVEEIDGIIDNLTREVLKMTLDGKSSGGIPRSVRHMFWKSVKSFHLFYMKEDLFNSSTKLVKVVQSLINDPVSSTAFKDCVVGKSFIHSRSTK